MKLRCGLRSDVCCGWPITKSPRSHPEKNFSIRSRTSSQPVCCSQHVDIPVIFITASDAEDIDQTAAQSGARLLRKPFSNDVLLAAVEAALCG